MRALRSQEESLTELRSRAGTLLAAASLAASFLGGQALARHGINVFAILALIAFAASIVLCVSVLLPKDDLVFSLDATATYRELYDNASEPLEVQRRLADTLQAFRAENQPALTDLFRRFRWASLALGVEVLAWALELALS